MKTVIEKSAAAISPMKATTAKAPHIAAASVPDTLAMLNVDPDTGLTHEVVDSSFVPQHDRAGTSALAKIDVGMANPAGYQAHQYLVITRTFHFQTLNL